MKKPKTPMPPQIQKCHDVWANTLEGQKRLLAVELQRMMKNIIDELGRVGKRFFEAAVSVTQFGMEGREALRRLTKARRKR